MSQQAIRNFCIIAHIDHGKSTLADRLLEYTHTVAARDMHDQLLDTMDIEKERGITIKLQPVRMKYESGGIIYQLNLIDTPGHVDFTYEVSRSLAACEGALLIVDATQGIQAQTLANVYLALNANLEIIPVINKIDLPAAEVEKTSREIISLLGCKEEDILKVSAKTGEGVGQVLEEVVAKVPAPRGNSEAPLRALVFDSFYDDYRGVVLYIRLVDGELTEGETITMHATNARGSAMEVGHLNPKNAKDPKLNCGEIGYVVTDFKETAQARVGDTVMLTNNLAPTALPGYKLAKPFVYAGMFPVSSDEHQKLKEALEKLSLSDSSLTYEPENSQILGFGFRVGFLGLLHLDIVRERLERYYDLEIIITNPSTDYKLLLLDRTEVDIKCAEQLPDPTKIVEIREPWVKGEIVCPREYVGGVLQLIITARGMQKKIDYLDNQLATIDFEAPLANMLTDFYDQLKSITSGYGSFNYELDDYRAEDLVRLDFLVAGERMDSLSVIVHQSEADRTGRNVVKSLKKIIPKQLFEVALQAAIGGRIIARESISALKKNVTGNIYGGDVSRKKKLWAKQKKGKARMKKFGKVDIPAEAFTVMISREQK